MAAGIMPPEKGGEFSPCEDCEHIDCAALRKRAAAICHYCGEAIGWDVRFYNDQPPNSQGRVPASELVPVHALCLELDVEKQQRNR